MSSAAFFPQASLTEVRKETTWEVVCVAYPYAAAAFPALSPATNADMVFLASLLAKEGALAFNEKGAGEFKIGKGACVAQNMKAALAQAAGLVMLYVFLILGL